MKINETAARTLGKADTPGGMEWAKRYISQPTREVPMHRLTHFMHGWACMCACIYIYVRTCIPVHTHIHAYAYDVCMDMHMRVYMHMHAYAYMRVHMHA